MVIKYYSLYLSNMVFETELISIRVELQNRKTGDVSLCVPIRNGYGTAGLRSLWDMLEFDAEAFYGSTYHIAHMIEVIKSWDDQKIPTLSENDVVDRESANFLIGHLKALMPHLKTLNAKITNKACDRLQTHLEFDNLAIKFGEVARRLADISLRLADELSLSKMFVLESDRHNYFDPSSPLLGREVQAKFISALFEIDEAGKCFALARPTACVFHLMRVMEVAVRAVARCLSIPDPTRPAERNWGFILGEIWKGIEARWPTTASRLSGDGETFESIYVSLDAVKNPWRNSTMHPANKYTDDEAEHIFVAVRGFMMKLASRCDENGEPKA